MMIFKGTTKNLISLPILLLFVFLTTTTISVQSQECSSCGKQSSCEIVSSSEAIIQAQVFSQRKTTTTTTTTTTTSTTTSSNIESFNGIVKKSFKGNFEKKQKFNFYSDFNCVKLKEGRTYVLGLNFQGTEWWVRNCSIHTIKSKIGTDLWNTINNASGICGECSSMKCTPVTCNNGMIPEGQCCPVCPIPSSSGCEFMGSQWLDGQTILDSPCQTCKCQEGQVRCTFTDCVDPGCENPIVPEGQCCPVCPSTPV